MMYFSRLKAAAILGVCLLGLLVSLPNVFPAPVSWLPWRTAHLGLDLKGGSYLLMEVDMKAVIKERLDSLVDAVRQALRPGAIFFQTLDAQPDQNRVVLRLRDPAKTDTAMSALLPLVQRDGPNNAPDLDIVTGSDGNRSRSSAAVSTKLALSILRSPSRATAASSYSCLGSRIRTGSSNCSARPRI